MSFLLERKFGARFLFIYLFFRVKRKKVNFAVYVGLKVLGWVETLRYGSRMEILLKLNLKELAHVPTRSSLQRLGTPNYRWHRLAGCRITYERVC